MEEADPHCLLCLMKGAHGNPDPSAINLIQPPRALSHQGLFRHARLCKKSTWIAHLMEGDFVQLLDLHLEFL